MDPEGPASVFGLSDVVVEEREDEEEETGAPGVRGVGSRGGALGLEGEGHGDEGGAS